MKVCEYVHVCVREFLSRQQSDVYHEIHSIISPLPNQSIKTVNNPSKLHHLCIYRLCNNLLLCTQREEKFLSKKNINSNTLLHFISDANFRFGTKETNTTSTARGYSGEVCVVIEL